MDNQYNAVKTSTASMAHSAIINSETYTQMYTQMLCMLCYVCCDICPMVIHLLVHSSISQEFNVEHGTPILMVLPY